jgi:hypothetical protein
MISIILQEIINAFWEVQRWEADTEDDQIRIYTESGCWIFKGKVGPRKAASYFSPSESGSGIRPELRNHKHYDEAEIDLKTLILLVTIADLQVAASRLVQTPGDREKQKCLALAVAQMDGLFPAPQKVASP